MKNVAIIGIDGSGKTTQVSMLANAIEKNSSFKAEVVDTRGDNHSLLKFLENKNYEIPQKILLIGYSLDLANKFKRMEDKDNNRTIFVWDRYYHCLDAYFSYFDLDMDDVKHIISIVKEPIITFYLDIEPEGALSRVEERDGITKLSENKIFLGKVREQYLKMSEKSNIIVVDASGSPDDVHSQIWDKYLSYFNLSNQMKGFMLLIFQLVIAYILQIHFS